MSSDRVLWHLYRLLYKSRPENIAPEVPFGTIRGGKRESGTGFVLASRRASRFHGFGNSNIFKKRLSGGTKTW